MSRFWAAGSSESESENSDASSSVYSSGGSAAGKAGAAGNRWAELSDSESSEDQVRVVKSGKERALETFQRLIKSLRNNMKERDYYAVSTEFDELAKAMLKAKQYLADGVPRPLVKMLVDLEDYVTERLKDKAQFKVLSARQGRALNKMKLTLKKHNKAYEVVMEAYRLNPMVEEKQDDSSSDEDDDDDEKSVKSDDSSKSDTSDKSGSSKSSDSGSESVRSHIVLHYKQ
jgi:translation initiation factor 3 subunit C